MINCVNFCAQTSVQQSPVRFKEIQKPPKQTNSLSSAKLQEQLCFLGARNKLYLNTINFGSHDKSSFSEFDKARINCGINTLEDLRANIKSGNLLGEGLNSRVYKFDDEALDNWALKEDKNPFWNPCKGNEFRPVADDFDGINMGQEIAQAGDCYHILKKIGGEPHSLDDWSAHINNNGKVTKKESILFVRALNEIADFDQSVFDDYARQLKLLGQKGFKQDSINPNNLMIDYKNKKIQIIDFFKAVDPSHINSRLDLCNPLLDFSLFNNIYDKLSEAKKDELLDSAKTIIQKCNIASKKYDLPQDEQTYINYLANVDKWFGFKLVDKGGDYRSRYAALKTLLPEVCES